MENITFVRINDNFEVHLVVQSYAKVDEQYVEGPEGNFRLTTYLSDKGIKLYTFGYNVFDPKAKPDHGGEWSSNSTCINEKFGVKIAECAVKCMTGNCPGSLMAMACDIEWIKSIKPDCLVWEPRSVYIDGSLYQPFEDDEFPRGLDYFQSTVLDAKGELVYPNIKHLEECIIKGRYIYHWDDNAPRMKSFIHWLKVLKHKNTNQLA